MKNDKSLTALIFWKRLRILLLIGIVALLVAGSLTYSAYAGNRMSAVYTPLSGAAKEIISEATTAHLWFEEVVSGDRNADLDAVWFHIKEAIWLAQAMLEGGTRPQGMIIPLKDPVLRSRIEEVLESITEFRTIAEQRYRNLEISPPGSEIDQHFDAIFTGIIQKADLVDMRLRELFRKDLRLFRLLQTSLIAITLILGMVVGTAIYRYDRRRERHVADLWESEEKFRIITNNAQPIIFIINKEGTFLLSEGRDLASLGLEPGQVVGMSAFEIYKDYPAIIQGLNEAMNGNTTTDVINVGGIYFDIIYTPYYDQRDSVQGIMGMAIDITERERSEKERSRLLTELAEKNAELEQVVYVTSHDLRSPLVNIQGFSKELELQFKELKQDLEQSAAMPADDKKMRLILDEEVPESLRYIISSTAKMDTLLTGLLRLSRLGRASLNIQRLDMNQVLAKVSADIEFRVKQQQVSLQIDDLPPCMGDEAQVNQVFANLLDNALKYLDSSREGVVTVSGEARDDRVVYQVEDNGIGISEEQQSRIFDIFYRLDPENYPGEGLGLTIVRRGLARLGGNIRVESNPGEKTAFVITLPKG
jgi:PAS domain S-box-containing protein